MKRIIITMAIAIGLSGCNSNNENKMEAADHIQSDSSQSFTTDAPIPKIIKTADLKFRVKDVPQTKTQISTILKALGGTVVEFSIESTVKKTDRIQYTRDSLKEMTAYRTDGFLVAKVPAAKIDDFTNIVSGMAIFTDQASMKMDDQSAIYAANKLRGKNRTDAAGELNNVDTNRIASIEKKMALKDENVAHRIDNWTIDSRVKFSTITLNFYQDNAVKTTLIANDNLEDYRPAFFSRLGLNLLNGWNAFEEILLLLSNVWVLIIIGIAVFFGLKYYRIKRI